MEGSYTIKQVIEITMNNLKCIRLTVDQVEEIGKPISDAVHNLQAVINAIKANEQQQASAKAEAEKFAAVPEGAAPEPQDPVEGMDFTVDEIPAGTEE